MYRVKSSSYLASICHFKLDFTPITFNIISASSKNALSLGRSGFWGWRNMLPSSICYLGHYIALHLRKPIANKMETSRKKRWNFYCFLARVVHLARAVFLPMIISWSINFNIPILIAFIYHFSSVYCHFTHLLINRTINDVDRRIRFNRSIS